MFSIDANLSHTLLPDLDRHKSDASADVLKRQVEAFLCHWSNLPDLGVEAKDTVSKIGLCEAFICRYGVHLQVKRRTRSALLNLFYALLLLTNNLGVVGGSKACSCRKRFFCLHVEEVEGFFAGTRHPRNGVTVTESETQLHIYLDQNRHKSIQIQFQFCPTC